MPLSCRVYAHDIIFVVQRVSVSHRALQCRVRHFTPTYDMTKEFQTNKKFVYKYVSSSFLIT